MKLPSNIVIIFLGSVVSFFIVSYISILLSSLLFITRRNIFSLVTSVSNDERYRLLQVNTLTNTSSVGYVSLNEKLDEFEFRSYYDDDSYYLISNFGEAEYQCTGTCFCNEENSPTGRRYSHTTTSRSGIFYLLTAVSTLVAYNLAKEYFDEECRSQFSDSCSNKDNVESTVDSCGDIEENEYNDDDPMMTRTKFTRTPREALLKKEKIYEKSKQDKNIRRYFCVGNCQKKTFKNQKPRKLAEDFRCSELGTEAIISLDANDVKRESNLNLYAQKCFLRDILNPFCKENSMGEYIYKLANNSYTFRVQTVFLCVGGPAGKKLSLKCAARRDFRYFNIPPPKSSRGVVGGGSIQDEEIKKIEL